MKTSKKGGMIDRLFRREADKLPKARHCGLVVPLGTEQVVKLTHILRNVWGERLTNWANKALAGLIYSWLGPIEAARIVGSEAGPPWAVERDYRITKPLCLKPFIHTSDLSQQQSLSNISKMAADIVTSSSSSSAFNVRGPHITQAWDVRHPRWHGSDGCPQQHSVVSCTNSTTFNGSGYTRLCQGSSMNSWLTWGYWYMFLLLKELLQPDGLPAPTHPLGRGVFNETPSPNTITMIKNGRRSSTK